MSKYKIYAFIVFIAIISSCSSCENILKNKSSRNQNDTWNPHPIDTVFNSIPYDSLPLVAFERFRCAAKYGDYNTIKALCSNTGLNKLNDMAGDLSIDYNRRHMMNTIDEMFKRISKYEIKNDRLYVVSKSRTLVYQDGVRQLDLWNSMVFEYRDSLWLLTDYRQAL